MVKAMIKTSTVALILALGSTTLPAHAENNEVVVSSESEITYELTKEQKKALEFYEAYLEELQDDSSEDDGKLRLLAAYDKNQKELRQGNVIEAFLNEDEGLTISQMSRLKDYADEARDTAAKYYKNDSMLRDAYRHFLWNYLGANDSRLGQTKTRVATTNHEWGLILRQDALDYYDQRLEYYTDLGLNGLEAMGPAFGDTLNRLPRMKRNKITSYSEFKQVADDSNVMDWNNNYYGRYYSYIGDKDDAFKQAKPFLILAENKVKTSDYRKVYDGNWYK
ncbi:hypothetical protein ACFLFF_28850 [Brevibacillus reuszeri]|uniref:hypothetical protein n=1 Tax=Brevibacillus reuszeri TaxID=54915 RepID=UPI00366F466A